MKDINWQIFGQEFLELFPEKGFEPSMHPVAIEFDLVQPVRAFWCLLHERRKLRLDPGRWRSPFTSSAGRCHVGGSTDVSRGKRSATMEAKAITTARISASLIVAR